MRPDRHYQICAEIQQDHQKQMRRLRMLILELTDALQPFVLLNSSDEQINLIIRTSDIAKARAALKKAEAI